jgi:hypothetical protein
MIDCRVTPQFDARQHMDALIILRFHRRPRSQQRYGWGIPWYDALPADLARTCSPSRWRSMTVLRWHELARE